MSQRPSNLRLGILLGLAAFALYITYVLSRLLELG